MDHSIAIECLKDDLEQAKTDSKFLATGIASMMMRNTGSPRIREDAILRWKKKLDIQRTRVRSLKATIKYLEQHSKEGK